MSNPQRSLRLTMNDDLRAWLDAEAESMGLDAASWIRMQLTRMRKGVRAIPLSDLSTMPYRAPAHPEPSVADPEASQLDVWRGPVEDAPSDAAIEAVVEGALANAVPTPRLEPVEMFARSSGAPINGAVRALSVPPRAYSPANRPPGM